MLGSLSLPSYEVSGVSFFIEPVARSKTQIGETDEFVVREDDKIAHMFDTK